MSQTENGDKFKELISTCDLLIKAGKLHQVGSHISKLNMSQVPREHRQSLAKICRRAVLIQQGLRLLHPIIRQEKMSSHPPTGGEVCEYAVLLIRNGSVSEAEALLNKVDVTESPEALMYLGFVAIAKWDYVPAAEFLQKFLLSKADDYTKLIASVNLASCFVVLSRLTEAAELLNKAIEGAEKVGATRLVGNCYELFGQVFFWQEKFQEAREALKKASAIFGQAQSYDQLLIYKTESIMTALESKSVLTLARFREEALARKHWESVREADLFTLKVNFDQSLMDHLVCGTPLAHYRARIQNLVGHPASSYYVFGQNSDNCLDLQTGLLNGEAEFVSGRKIHQVIAALIRDFYAPRNIGHLFAELYPGEFFNVSSSNFRVRQLIVRARAWLREKGIPASIEQTASHYRLVIHGDFGIRIPLEAPAIDLFEVRWRELVCSFPKGLFTADEACTKLRIPRTTLRRLIDWGLQSQLLERTGVGRATHYRIKSVNAADKASA